jgi:hypothetical protein
VRRPTPGAGVVAACLACALAATACGSSAAVQHGPAVAPDTTSDDRARTGAFAQVEDEALGWLAAADPRVAQRVGAGGSAQAIERIGYDAMMAEDSAAQIRAGSLDLFAFRARAHALDEAGKAGAALPGALPEVGPLGSALSRPRLERELLGRLIAEERARAEDEAKLGDASGDLVRGILATWTPPATPQEVPERDAWVSKHLLEIRDSLRGAPPHVGPPDLSVALHPLERLLGPMAYPKTSAAIAWVLIAIDADARAVPRLPSAEHLARQVKVHLGLDVETAALPKRLEALEARMREVAERALEPLDAPTRRAAETKARTLLLAERPCAPVADSRVRTMAPPPERAAVCGALRALTDEPVQAAALVALHDDVVLATATVLPAPPLRTRLLSRAEDDDVDTLERTARERPIVALGVAFAAELLYEGDGATADERLATWRALGEAPLDVVARELAPKRAAGDGPRP